MTIKEIAALAGVSISTVSKVINRKDQNINPETRKRVLQIVKEYHYSPYGAVRNLSEEKNFLLGVLLRDTAHSGQMVQGILQAAQEAGYSVLLFDSGLCPENEAKHISALCARHVDGVLWEPVRPEDPDINVRFSSAAIPVCFINSPRQSDCVFLDFSHLGYLCARQLIDRRHSRIGCLIQENSLRSQQVLEGVQKCLFDNGLPYSDTALLPQDNIVSDLFSRKLTGVVSSHFLAAAFLYQKLRLLHYDVPGDFSLISLRSDANAAAIPPVSAYTIPFRDFGYETCRTFLQNCEQPASDMPYRFQKEYFVDSEATLAVSPDFRRKKILVVGSIHMDYTFTVDTLPQPGRVSSIRNVSSCLGGKGSNQAVGVARLGHETALIGKTGNDADANFIFQTLDHENIPAQGILRDSDCDTGKAYVQVQSDGESTIAILPGANSSFLPEDIYRQEHLFRHSDFCLISAEIPAETVIAAADTAKKYGVRTIVKPASLETMPDRLYALTDLFVPNRKEAAILCPGLSAVEEQADFFFRKGIPVVILTLGKDGCFVKTADFQGFFDASGSTAVDTTGGADAFISALAVSLSDGYPLQSAVKIAQYAAGFCISRQGVIPALADKNTLRSYIGRTEPELLL